MCNEKKEDFFNDSLFRDSVGEQRFFFISENHSVKSDHTISFLKASMRNEANLNLSSWNSEKDPKTPKELFD